MATVAIVGMDAINLRGAGQAAAVEMGIVVVKLAILAVLGLSGFDAGKLEIASQPGLIGIVIGAASVFMAYEGFELLAYDYDEMEDHKATLTKVMPLAIGSAALISVLVGSRAVRACPGAGASRRARRAREQGEPGFPDGVRHTQCPCAAPRCRFALDHPARHGAELCGAAGACSSRQRPYLN